MLYRVFDAAYPPPAAPPGCTGVLGYIGGSHAAHVWPATAWKPFRNLRQFPCWVPAVTDNAVEAGQFAVRAALELGWAPGPTVGPRVIVCDLETIEDRVLVRQLGLHGDPARVRARRVRVTVHRARQRRQRRMGRRMGR